MVGGVTWGKAEEMQGSRNEIRIVTEQNAEEFMWFRFWLINGRISDTNSARCVSLSLTEFCRTT